MTNHFDSDLFVAIMAERGMHENSDYAIERIGERINELPMQEMLRQLIYFSVASVGLVQILEYHEAIPEGTIDNWIQILALDSRSSK